MHFVLLLLHLDPGRAFAFDPAAIGLAKGVEPTLPGFTTQPFIVDGARPTRGFDDHGKPHNAIFADRHAGRINQKPVGIGHINLEGNQFIHVRRGR